MYLCVWWEVQVNGITSSVGAGCAGHSIDTAVLGVTVWPLYYFRNIQ